MTAEKAIRDGPPGGPGPPATLRQHRDFNRLWLGQAVSDFGSQVTLVALPLTAVLYLKATAGQVGLMTSATQLAFLGPMLFFGVMVDRVRKRPVMIGADIGRTVVLALVPILAWTRSLTMPVLYAVALVHGCLSVLFELAYRSYLPSLIDAEHLLSGNSRLQSTESISQVAGPAVGGALVQLLSAPFALLADAGSFVLSVVSLLSIRVREPSPQRPHGENGATGFRGMVADIRSGLRFIYRHRVLRSLAGGGATLNFFSWIQVTLFVVYAARDMHMSGGMIGLVFAGFGAGGVLAATMLGRALTWFGYGHLLLVCYTVAALALVAIPFVRGPATLSTALFVALYVLAGTGIVALNIVSMTLRQVVTPSFLQARVNASFKFALSALTPVSAAVAGVLGDSLGLRTTLFIMAAGMPLTPLWIVFSPIRSIRTLEQLLSLPGAAVTSSAGAGDGGQAAAD
jgi:MFS family permease